MAKDEEDSAITFETFRKFQRKEKKNEKLQELPEDFFQTCVKWINRKQDEFENERDSTLLHELENVKNIVSDIFERRRKKILILALHSVRSKRVSENLLPEEKEFFEKTVENLRDLEENLLEKVLKGKKPGSGEAEKEEEETDMKEEEETTEEEDGEGDGEEEREEKEEEQEVKTRKLKSDDKKGRIKAETGKEEKLVRVLERVDRFMGTDENEYGPLEKGDIVTLPKEVAELLVEKDKVKESEI